MKWRKHPDFPDYKISENADVIRLRSSRCSKEGALLKGRILISGYRQFKLVDKNGYQQFIRANRLIAELFLGPPPSSKHHAAHNDGNKLNNHWSNLRWATPKENCADKLIHGTHQRGSRSGMAKLREDKIIEILFAKTGKHGEIAMLARKYKVGRTTIKRVLDRESWKHVSIM